MSQLTIIAPDISKQETLKSPDDIEMMDVNSMKPAGQLLRRNRPGTSARNWCNWPDEELDEMDSTLATQQVRLFSKLFERWTQACHIKRFLKYIQQLIKKDTSVVDDLLKVPDQQDEGVWKYEHLREFCLELNLITIRLQEECNPTTCSQMTATEQWIDRKSVV